MMLAGCPARDSQAEQEVGWQRVAQRVLTIAVPAGGSTGYTGVRELECIAWLF